MKHKLSKTIFSILFFTVFSTSYLQANPFQSIIAILLANIRGTSVINIYDKQDERGFIRLQSFTAPSSLRIPYEGDISVNVKAHYRYSKETFGRNRYTYLTAESSPSIFCKTYKFVKTDILVPQPEYSDVIGLTNQRWKLVDVKLEILKFTKDFYFRGDSFEVTYVPNVVRRP